MIKAENRKIVAPTFQVISGEEALLHSEEKLASSLHQIIELKDRYTARHCRGVAKYSEIIGRKILDKEAKVQELYLSALLHDIGKIAIDLCVLHKETSLSEREKLHIQTHPEKGAQILEIFDFSPGVIDGAWHHHERWDGGGYPDGLKGEGIALSTRIISIADALDAMNSERPYRKPLSKDAIIEQIERESGVQFDSEISSIVLKLLKAKKSSNQLL